MPRTLRWLVVVVTTAFAMCTSVQSAGPDSYVLETVLLDLRVATLPAPAPASAGLGGAITVVGKEALVVDHRGVVLTLRGEQLSPSRVQVPDDGHAEYRAKADGKYWELPNEPRWQRFTDLLFFDDGRHAGLAVVFIKWFDDRDCYANVVAVADLPVGTNEVGDLSLAASDWREIFVSQPCQALQPSRPGLKGATMGGRLAYLGDGRFALSSGEATDRGYAQRDDVDYGRILEIGLDGGPARTIAKGLRNPQGLLLDNASRLWTVVHGPHGGDELNLIREGANFGWPLAAYGVEYGREPIASVPRPGRHDGFPAPVFAWLPSIAPSSLLRLQGFHAAWDGDLLVGALAAEALYRLRLEGERVVYVETVRMATRVRDVEQLADGQLLVWTDAAELMILTPAASP